jgi:hypothetical protein
MLGEVPMHEHSKLSVAELLEAHGLLEAPVKAAAALGFQTRGHQPGNGRWRHESALGN